MEPMTLPKPQRQNRNKKPRTMTLAPSDVAIVEHFQQVYKLDSFSQALRRIIRDYDEMNKGEEQAA